MNKPKQSFKAGVPAKKSAGASAHQINGSAPSYVRKKRKSSLGRASRRKGGRKPLWRRIPFWGLLAGLLLVVGLYLFVFYYFFVGPFSFRWKAIYGEPDYPNGFEIHGLDISHYQENVDWERLRNARIQGKPVCFVFIKATEGVSIIDENFNDNFYQARQNDLLRSAYHFFVPDVDAAKQAKFFLKQVHLEAGDLPPVLDVEKAGKLTPQQLQKAVKQWLDIIELHYGVKPILYTGYSFKQKYLNTPEFDDYPYWIAHYYVKQLEYKGAWSFWQYTDVGRVEGIRGNVDFNIFKGTLEELHALTIDADAIDLVGLNDDN